MNNIDTINQSDLLAGISQKQSADILSLGDKVRFQSGDILFHEGDPASKCYLLKSGRLKLVKLHEQGKESIIRYIGPGELTAAIAVFKGKEYPVTAEAIGDTDAIVWDKVVMARLMLEYPQFTINIMRVVVDRMFELQARYIELNAEQVEQRVARSLLRIMKQSGRVTDSGIDIDFPLSRQELADYSGATIYTVSRILSAWEKKGWIKSGREHITVVDARSIARYAEFE